MKKIMLVVMVLIIGMIFTGCEAETEKYSFVFENQSKRTVIVQPATYQEWDIFDVQPGKKAIIEIRNENIGFTYETIVPCYSSDVGLEKTNGVYVFKNKNSSQIEVTNLVRKYKNGLDSGATFSINLMSWGAANDTYGSKIASGEEENKYYTENNGKIPVITAGAVVVQKVLTDDTPGKYLYYAITGTNGLSYYKTTKEIAVGPKVKVEEKSTTDGTIHVVEKDLRTREFTFYYDSTTEAKIKLYVRKWKSEGLDKEGKEQGYFMEEEVPVEKIK